MIVGVGIDVVDVSRIEALLERYAERFQHRVFTREEIRCCMARSNPSQHFAARFAAKEAAAKALGTGFGRGIRLRDIEVAAVQGVPRVLFHNKARQCADGLGVSAVHVSISHERLTAAAVVILEKRECLGD